MSKRWVSDGGNNGRLVKTSPGRDDDDGTVDGISSLDGIEPAPEDKSLSSPLLTASDAAADKNTPISYYRHLVDVIHLTYPIILGELLQNILPTVDVIFVGQLGKDELGAAALATVWFNILDAFMIGLMTAIDTLLSTAFGAREYDQYRIITGNSLIIVFLATIVMSGLMALCSPAMHLFGQDPILSDEAGRFSIRLIPGLFPYYSFRVLTKYLQTQRELAQGIWIGLLANGFNALLNWILVYQVGWGLDGVPWASTLTRALELLVIIVYMFIRRRKLKRTWPKFSCKFMRREVLKPFFQLAGPGSIAMAVASATCEISTILAGLLGTVQLGAVAMIWSIYSIIFSSFAFDVGFTASIQVGKLIGEQRPRDAQRSSLVVYLLSCTIQLVLIGIVMPLRDSLGSALSTDDDVSSLISQLIPVMCIFVLGDTIQGISGGVLRGLGRQSIAFLLNAFALGLVGLTTGSLLAFVADLDVFGLWWGMIAGVYFCTFFGLCIIACWIDWNEESKTTIERMSSISTGLAAATQQEASNIGNKSFRSDLIGLEYESDEEPTREYCSLS